MVNPPQRFEAFHVVYCFGGGGGGGGWVMLGRRGPDYSKRPVLQALCPLAKPCASPRLPVVRCCCHAGSRRASCSPAPARGMPGSGALSASLSRRLRRSPRQSHRWCDITCALDVAGGMSASISPSPLLSPGIEAATASRFAARQIVPAARRVTDLPAAPAHDHGIARSGFVIARPRSADTDLVRRDGGSIAAISAASPLRTRPPARTAASASTVSRDPAGAAARLGGVSKKDPVGQTSRYTASRSRGARPLTLEGASTEVAALLSRSRMERLHHGPRAVAGWIASTSTTAARDGVSGCVVRRQRAGRAEPPAPRRRKGDFAPARSPSAGRLAEPFSAGALSASGVSTTPVAVVVRRC